MFEIQNILLFMLAGITLNFTPGPDMMYVITRSVTEGRYAGIASAFGIAGGTIIHTLAVAFGLTGLLLAVPSAYVIIKLVGAAYLVYLGFRTLFKRQKDGSLISGNKKSIKSIFYQGVLTNVFNPKVALFFLAFLPQFIDPSKGSIALQIILLGLIFNTTGTIVNVIVAITASRLGNKLKTKLNNSSLFKWIAGTVFISLGIRLALLERK